MDNFNFARFALLVGAMIVNIFLVWFGGKLLQANPHITDTQYFLLGCGLTIGALYAISGGLVPWGFFLMLVAIYFFGRGSGEVQTAWLGKLLGILSILSAILFTYVVLPRDRQD